MKIHTPLRIGMLCGLLTAFTLETSAQTKVHYVQLKEGLTYTPNAIQEQTDDLNAEGDTYKVTLYPKITFQTMKGIGGAFNEQGGEAYMRLPQEKKADLAQALFSKAKGAGFNFCRTAVGASDFGLTAYSYSEVPEDYEMKHFSIERDKKSIIPFMQDAMKYNPELTLFASPWSPPGWMKRSGKMDQGINLQAQNYLRNEEKVYQAYALYLLKYIKAYAAEGIDIERILIQNEQDLHTNYPSCCIPVEQFSKFGNQYLRRLFTEKHLPTEIWAGTFRAAGNLDFLEFLTNKENTKSFDGMGIQYMAPQYITEIYQLNPQINLMHTESVCYNGDNSVTQALTRLEEVAGYINGGCTNFCYWNMVLNEEQKSGWGWKQNALVIVNRNTKQITYTPDYAVFLLMGKFIRPGVQRIANFSRQTTMSFRDENKMYLFVQNAEKQACAYECQWDNRIEKVILPAQSLCVIELDL